MRAALLCLMACPVAADPVIMTDILPVESITARIMEGVGRPDVLLPANSDPHSYAMRPSDARRLSKADLMVWAGPGMAPWLEGPVDGLTRANLALITEDGVDPHGWLDPQVGAAWGSKIAEALAAQDPDNAEIYRVNATDFAEEMAALEMEIAEGLTGVSGSYVLPHDAYSRFIFRFGLPEGAAIADPHGHAHGAAHVSEIVAQSEDVDCVFTDHESGPQWVELFGGPDKVNTAHLDPLGKAQDQGPSLYPALLRAMAEAFETCLN